MRGSLTARLLAHAATGAPLDAHAAFGSGVAAGEQERQLRWLLDGGLGPLLHHATRAQPQGVPEAWRHALLSADLTARMRHATLQASVRALLSACAALRLEPTLLKGISASEQLYPEPHLRPMSDFDVLLPPQRYSEADAALTAEGGGWERTDFPALPGMHHDAPLRHRAHGGIVELHRALFPSDSPFSAGSLFAPAQLLSRSQPSSWHGEPVRRLPPELQLPYIAASWFNDLSDMRVHPSFLPSLVDALLLLRRFGPTLDWALLRGWLDNELARGCLYALLAYVPRFGATPAPADFMAWLGRSQRVAGALQLRLIHHMLDRHLVAARPWTLPFPPPVPGRYSPAYQWRKRLRG
ncbi:nucleotidyltransferase family protein [Azohydromonas aeria]|uniref:nucleotidyltransferase family protein n=1 Tax=Azohydromonas aeria TaxID=2590212 RepID=UPI0012FC4816|nr:nucleotidyltransferase family protein [Azohydromonas aeria]